MQDCRWYSYFIDILYYIDENQKKKNTKSLSMMGLFGNQRNGFTLLILMMDCTSLYACRYCHFSNFSSNAIAIERELDSSPPPDFHHISEDVVVREKS